MDVTGCVAIVTGGASGLGAATARALAARGAQVVVFDRDATLGSKVAAEIDGSFAEVDVADEEQVSEAVRAASELGPLRVVVNCAGLTRAARVVNRRGEPFPLDDFEFVIRVNLIGTFNCMRLGAAAMSALEPLAGGARGVVINTASLAAFEGQVGQTAYSASKGGIVGLTLPAARDLGPLGIRVNTIAPGLVDTPIYDQLPDADNVKAVLAADVVFPNRFATAPEFAHLALALIENDYMNGETVRFDGALRLR